MKELYREYIEFIELFPFPSGIIELVDDSIKIYYINSKFKLLNNDIELVIDPKLDSDSIYKGMLAKDKKRTDNTERLIKLLKSVNKQEIGYCESIINRYSKRKLVTDESDNNYIFFKVIAVKMTKSLISVMYVENFDKNILKNIGPNTLILDMNDKGGFHLENHKITNINKQFKEITGYYEENEILNKDINEFLHLADKTFFNGFLEDHIIEKNNRKNEIMIRFLGRNKEYLWLNLSISKTFTQKGYYFIFIVEDITEKKKTELALFQTHRLASVGELTAGVAHEINNPLFGIMNYAALIKDSIDEGIIITKESEDYEFLVGIIKEAERISKIIGNLSEFSRRSEDKEYVKTNIRNVVKKVEKLLSYQIRHSHIEIIKNIDDNVPLMMLQQYRIGQALFNIILNSIQALESIQNRKKEIKINIKSDKSNGHEILHIDIIDNGEGISEENIVKLFTPFYTTKRNIKGTGLGLYTVFQIINDHSGSIKVDSQEGFWTKVQIVLPINRI